jgi:hypothetical protein
MISFMNASPTWADVREKYGDRWRQRAETSRPGLNVTTLFAHSVVAGKVAALLSGIQQKVVTGDATWEEAKGSFDKIRLAVAHYSIGFYQRPFRVGEWNIFAQRHELLEKVCAHFERNVIGRAGNQVVAVFTSKDDAKTFGSKISSKGFRVDLRLKEAPVSELRSHGLMDVILKRKSECFYEKEPPERIDIPICEVCQMAQADHRWPADHLALMLDLQDQSRRLLRETRWRDLAADDFPAEDRPALAGWLAERGEEDLCPQCFDLRHSAPRLRKLSEWQGYSVAWVRVALDLDRLGSALGCLQKSYVKQCLPDINQKTVDEVKVRFPLLVDFIEDYRAALTSYGCTLVERFGDDGVETVDDDLWCVRLEHRSDALQILGDFSALMEKSFRKLSVLPIGTPSPIRLAVSVSPYKHPFFVHLRHLEGATADISVQLVGSGTANVALPFLAETLAAVERNKRRALHCLRGIAQTSRALAEVALRDRQDRDQADFAHLARLLPDKVDFQSLLTLTNLKEDSSGQDQY